MASDDSNLEKIDYFVYKYSSYSPNYFPWNIKKNNPADQSSRWSSETNNPPQYLLLKLSKFCIVQTITFGKYEKTHVCNLRKFKIYGGLTDENMLELLDGGLKNDNQAELFHLRHKVNGEPFACRFIKIVPLQSWGSSFNFTIWYVRLGGNSDWNVVEPALKWMSRCREVEAVRVCMKYLRQMNYRDSLECLKRESTIDLEDPILSQLYEYVIEGSYIDVETFMDSAIEDGLLNSYVSKRHYKPTWRNINVAKPRPGMRGGHQMCLDGVTEKIYLLGGWDGYQDLADLWEYHIPSNKWTLLSDDTSVEGGPTARSCHKMCLDPERRQIFVLGRYLDVEARSQSVLKPFNDFYVYNIESAEWTLITDDTSVMGGPRPIFDHQLCLDVSSRTLYVFGGRVLLPINNQCVDSDNEASGSTVEEPLYSGLYSYHVSTNTWTLICSDISDNDELPSLKSRVGHSMLFHPVSRNLYIFAGQRNKDYLNDFFSYNIDNGIVECICEEGLPKGHCLPAAGFTQRATIDPELDEIYVLSGLSKEKDKRDENIQNSFWVYYIKDNKWSCVYKNDGEGMNTHYHHSFQNEPCPRFAHQLVYNPLSKIHYLFGGNPGVAAVPKLRLDDFWKLHFNRRTNTQLQRQCKLLIRTFRYRELAIVNSVEALHYLQTAVSQVVDHDSPGESSKFQKLPEILFQEDTNISLPERKIKIHRMRDHMFDHLSSLFPESMAPPRISLDELIQL